MAGTIQNHVNDAIGFRMVSMESGLDGRNNIATPKKFWFQRASLNGVRPRWPEQYAELLYVRALQYGLNGVRPRWPEQ